MWLTHDCYSDKPTTAVESATTDSPPVEGRPYVLRCHVVDGRPMSESDIFGYQWYRNGAEVGNGAKELTIDKLSRQDGGVYTCAAENVVGLGSPGQSLNLSIWCK